MNKIALTLTAALMAFVSTHVQAKHKGFVISSDDGNYTMKLGGRMQVRYTYDAVDGFGSSDNAADESAFNIPRARLKLAGHLFDKKMTYYFQTDFGKGKAGLKDFFTDYIVHNKWLRIRTGQSKRPFSRQQLTSSGKQELVDRAITDKAFMAGRDIGIEIHNHYIKSPEFEYALGIYNGNGIKSDGFADRFNPTMVARLGYNYGGIKGYCEADFNGGPFRFAMATSALMNFDIDGDDTNDTALMGEIDFIMKIHGVTTSGAFYYSQANGESMLDGKTLSDAIGFHGQLGYLIFGKYQPVLRYAMVQYSETKTTQSEISAGISFYPHKHNFKWQSDVAMKSTLVDGSNTQDDYVIRTQLQVAF